MPVIIFHMSTPRTIYEQFDRTATSVPNQLFLWYEGETTTYTEAMQAVERRAAFLQNKGITSDDRIGILSPNHPEFVYLMFATMRLGATFVPFNYRQEGSVLEYLLADADVSMLIVSDDVVDEFLAVRDQLDTPSVYFFNEPTNEPCYSEALETVGTTDVPPVADVAPTDVAILSYTSGTTGPPKGVQNPHFAYVNAGHRLAKACRTDESDRAMLILPLFHANPMTYGLMQMLAVGGSIAPVRTFSASRFFETARASESTYFTHVGSILEILYRTLDSGSIDTSSSLKFAVGGAAQFENQHEFESRTDIQLVRLYGLSEAGGGMVTTCRYYPSRIHGKTHQGKVVDQPFEVQILADDGSSFADEGEQGEILVRPSLPGLIFRGYRGRPKTTVSTWQDLWLHTGDIGLIVDGTLRYVGREKTNIRKMGENISPWEIESAFADWPPIEEVIAVGVADQVAGEEIGLWVVPSNDDLTEMEVYKYCHENLSSHLHPRYIGFTEKVPRTSTHKVERSRLSDWPFADMWDTHDHIE
jgi:crotonobetaine/carnitine-CoA ligase